MKARNILFKNNIYYLMETSEYILGKFNSLFGEILKEGQDND